MRKVKSILCSLFTLTSLSASLCASAGDLTIINHTNYDSTSIINNGACSNVMGAPGITRAHTTNVVPEKLVIKACIFNKANCTAAVHMTNNCTGPVVATVIFDVAKGIKDIQPSSASMGYVMSGSEFTAIIEGGPAWKEWLKYF